MTLPNDNRKYVFRPDSMSLREEYPVISQWVTPGSRVIDLGCGDGSLLALLKKEKRVEGVGVEIAKSGLVAARRKGVKAVQGRIDVPLRYKNNTFDFAICNVTIQMVMYPELLLAEMKRIAKKQIVSFPNFAFYPNRLELFFLGRVPRTMLYGYSWYSTGHIHQLSVRDFEEFCRKYGFRVLAFHHNFPKRVFLIPNFLLRPFPNSWATTSVYLLE